MANGTPPAGICELMRALQNSDNAIRSEAEKKLMEAVKGAPDQLVLELLAVLGASNESASVELRQEAVVVLKQCAMEHNSKSCWKSLQNTTKEALKEQILVSLTKDPSLPVRRNAANVVSTVASTCANSYSELVKEWPRLLLFLSETISSGQAPQVTACLKVLTELVDLIGEELLKQGPQTVALLQTCLQSPPGEVRAAAVQLLFQMVEDLEEEVLTPLGPLMPQTIEVIKGFAMASEHEDCLKETLEALISSAEEEPEFFKAHGLQQLWPLLLEMCKADHWADSAVRHSAMEAVMSFFEGLCEDFCKPEGLPFLEQLLTLNIQWMLEVETNVELWTSKADEEDDEIDEDIVDIGEENLDRMASHCAEKDVLEDAFMPALFKVMRAILSQQTASWKEIRSCVMAVSQVVEYVEEEAWIDQCLDFIGPHLTNAHPRARYSAFQALGQTAYDHDPYVAENHATTLLPMIVTGLDDSNIRVATNAASALASMEDMDPDDLEPHMEGLMTRLITRLQKGDTRTMQETCLSAIAVVGEAAAELFEPYYDHILPMLKQLIATPGDQQRSLRGKAFECASLLGEGVGKEIFAKDAHEIMQIMVQHFKAGFAADDQTREYIHEAAGRVATVLGKDFKPYMSSLLPSLFTVLNQTPQEVALEDDDDEITHALVDGKLLGLKTAVLDEMTETLTLIGSLVEALEDDFVDFLPETCRQLMPLLDFAVSDEVQDKAYSTWEHVVTCARTAVDHGRCDKSLVGQVTGELLKKTVAMMTKLPHDSADAAALTQLQGHATATAAILKKAGPKVLANQDVSDLVKVLVELVSLVKLEPDVPVELAPKKSSGAAKDKDDSDSSDSESDEGGVTPQSVRYSLVDVVASLMKVSREEFVQVGLTMHMELLKHLLNNGNECDRSLALYMASDVVEHLGELSVPYWNSFMEIACGCITDKSPVIRQHAASVVGHGAKVAIFAQIAPVAAQQVARVLQKHGERHRRRRALNAEAKQVAMAVDSSIWALGMICEHQETNVGGDSSVAWKMWLSHMPPRCDREVGVKACSQLLGLMAKNHPVVTATEQQPRVLAILTEAYKSRNSNTSLDKEIAASIARAGAASVKNLATQLADRQQKKLEQILKDGEKGQSQEAMLGS